MVPVPTYQLIPFLAWLHQRGVRLLPARGNSEKLRELALQFLRDTPNQGFTSLAGLMTVFQGCPMIREPSVEEQMDHFAGCGACIEMIEERRQRLSEKDWAPWYGEGTLHPLLRGFVEWARGSQLDSLLRARESRYHREWDSSREFRHVIADVGSALRDHFRRYLFEIRERDPSLIDAYESWRRQAEGRPQRAIPRLRESDGRTQPLGPNESPNQAAQRLADSVLLAIDNGFYDDLIADEPRLARFMSLVMESPENLAQALEFINWLRQREPDLKLPGSIPANEFEGMALQFCEELGYSNGKSFSREAQRWLSGTGSDRLISRIARLLGIDRTYRLAKGQPAPRNPLDRYGAIRFHGMFIFLSSGDFPGFIESHWRDLHHLTGDELDIYFSQKDLSERTSGYEIVKELRSLQLRVDALPTLLLWENQLEISNTISLHDLNHGQIVDVVKTVVQAIRDRCSLSDVAQRGATRALELRTAPAHSVIFQNGAALLINHGGVMGDSYNVSGQAGAVGPGARASHMAFQQLWQQNASEIDLSRLAAELSQLRSAMRAEAAQPDHDQALGEVAAAETAAKQGDGAKALQHLKSAGRWALDVATKIGVNIASAALKASLGM